MAPVGASLPTSITMAAKIPMTSFSLALLQLQRALAHRRGAALCMDGAGRVFKNAAGHLSVGMLSRVRRRTASCRTPQRSVKLIKPGAGRSLPNVRRGAPCRIAAERNADFPF